MQKQKLIKKEIISNLISKKSILKSNLHSSIIKIFNIPSSTFYKTLQLLIQQDLIKISSDDFIHLTKFGEDYYYSKMGVKTITNDTIPIFLKEISLYYQILEPISYKGFEVYPLIKEINTDVISVFSAEKSKISNLEEIGSVTELHGFNEGGKPVLIPYLHQFYGGKQDRTVIDPIIIPGNTNKKPIIIPTRCIEHARWHFKQSKEFKSANSRMGTQMSVNAYGGDQSKIWNTVASAGAAMKVKHEEAPTGSYHDIYSKNYDSNANLNDFLTHLQVGLEHTAQVGILCVYKGRILGIEAYGSNDLWKDFQKIVLKGFLTDITYMEHLSTQKRINLLTKLRNDFHKIKIESNQQKELGNVVSFHSSKWTGKSIFYNNVPIHFYATKKHVELVKEKTYQRVNNIQRNLPNNMMDQSLEEI